MTEKPEEKKKTCEKTMFFVVGEPARHVPKERVRLDREFVAGVE